MENGVNDDSKGAGLGWRIPIPDCGEGIAKFIFAEPDLTHGGKKFPPEGLDGPADEAPRAIGEKVPGDEDGDQLLLGDLKGGEGKTVVRVDVALAA